MREGEAEVEGAGDPVALGVAVRVVEGAVNVALARVLVMLR